MRQTEETIPRKSMNGHKNPPVTLPTYFCALGLGTKEEEFLCQSMHELSRIMALPPLGVEHEFLPLPAAMLPRVEGVAVEQKDATTKYRDSLTTLLMDWRGNRVLLLILCPPSHPIVRVHLKKHPGKWGITYDSFALIWHLDNKYAIWHETLHLLGAEDCYDLTVDDRGPKCECRNCIMQYEAMEASVGSWPFLCQANIQRVRRRVRRQ